MTMYVTAVEVQHRERFQDATTFGDEGSRYVRAPGIITFDMSGMCSPEDLQLLWDLVKGDGRLDLFKSVQACEWCGALYPKKETRCRKGCGGPRTEGAR